MSDHPVHLLAALADEELAALQAADLDRLDDIHRRRRSVNEELFALTQMSVDEQAVLAEVLAAQQLISLVLSEMMGDVRRELGRLQTGRDAARAYHR